MQKVKSDKNYQIKITRIPGPSSQSYVKTEISSLNFIGAFQETNDEDRSDIIDLNKEMERLENPGDCTMRLSDIDWEQEFDPTS